MTNSEIYEMLMDVYNMPDLPEKAASLIGDAILGIDVQHEWIPVTERLPEDDTRVLICYRDKDDGSVDCDITTHGIVHFGGRPVATGRKEWRQPFAYFHQHYEVVAWCPLPAPYREDTDDKS